MRQRGGLTGSEETFMQTIEFFDRGAQLNPDGVAFVGSDGAEGLTYGQVESFTHRIAAGLHRDGLGFEAPVAVLSHNTPSLFPCVLGVLRAGCAWVALNARSAPQDLAEFLQLVGARMLFYSQSMAAAADECRSAVPTLERVIALEELEEWLPPAGVRVGLPPLNPEAIAGYFGTGGTTGRPKAVKVPHRAFETMTHAFNAHMPERDPVHLVAAPLTHAAGTMIFPVLSMGGTNVVHSMVEPAEILDSIERNRVTRLFLPPTAIYSLLAHPAARTKDMSSLRYFLYGAAPMSVDKLIEALSVFGPVMTQVYGQTEVPMFCTFFSPDEHAAAVAEPALRSRLASCGRPSLVANVAVMGDDGVLMPRGERGEIVVRSSLQMTGYHRAPEESAAVCRAGDWHATGDVGYVDGDGYVYLVDRKRDLIVSGGFNVYPGEIEQVIWGHPAVKDCAVIGLPDDKWGERVTAVVELKNGCAVEASELIARCRERFGGVQSPKEVIFRELPRSAVGKVLKRVLRDEYWAGRTRMI
jgi:acyl-CoA synthetase (AMP-forming)/AMP-acid ligase II